MIPSDQLPLRLNLRDDAIFDNFYVGDNALVIDALHRLCQRQEQFIYLYGEPCVGLSHLLQACCHSVADQKQRIFYLSLREHAHLSPAILEDLEHQQLVCLDDLDAVIGDQHWEESLFHFYNRARDNGVALVVSAREMPQALPCTFLDLRSRLAWGLVLSVAPLSDEQLIAALKMRAKNRGLVLPDTVCQFLLKQYLDGKCQPFSLLEKLDQASLVAKRKLTVPFVRAVLK